MSPRSHTPPVRTCVGCRTRFAQASLVRFRRLPGGWRADDEGRPRPDGRGAYLCSASCAGRVAKNKRYAGLAPAAQTIEAGRWRLP